ncbi:glycosyltransferase [Haliea sp.]|uniref:glycosyltransferase n=1 Tax=Haliea sp. TaxID=1932666 RepID=UPI003528F6CA
MNAPVVLFCYARAKHLRLTLESLKTNYGADDSELIVFSDAPKHKSDTKSVAEVRALLRNIEGFKNVRVIERPYNYGLSKSIVEGVSQVLTEYDRVIVLEDDMVTSPHFLNYMNQALSIYRNEDSVACIHGYVFPVKDNLPEAFFLPGADCWGWATWRNSWADFEPDGAKLLYELERRELLNYFDYNGAFPFSKMLRDQILGGNDSWAIRWYASALLSDRLTLYPGRSLVHNIGNDMSGVHSVHTKAYDTELSSSPIKLNAIDLCANQWVRDRFEEYLRTTNSINGAGRIRRLCTSLFGAVSFNGR